MMTPTDDHMAMDDDKQPKLAEEFNDAVMHCFLAYKIDVDSRQNSFDPWDLANASAEGGIQQLLKGQATALQQPVEQRLDFMSYEMDRPTKVDVRRSTYFYDSKDQRNYFVPPEFTQRVGKVFSATGECVKEYPDKSGQEDSIDIYIFEGDTGIVDGKPGFRSPMGFVAYDRKTHKIAVTFRGSRSGDPAKALVQAVLFNSGNPDWVSDMQLTGKLAENPGVAKVEQGRFQDGFAQSYLACQPALVRTIAGIIKTETTKNSEVKLNLDITGHSLGGALATDAFISAKQGSLGGELKAALGHDKSATVPVVDNLLEGAQCYAVSAPPVCNKAVAKSMEPYQSQFHRIHYSSDMIVTGSDLFRIGKEALVFLPSSHDLVLGKYSKKGQFFAKNIMDSHEPYLVHAGLQKQCGKTDKTMERNWLIINKQLQVVNTPSGKPEPISPGQAATIFRQFDVEYFLTLARTMVEPVEGEKPTAKTIELIAAIEEIGEIFHDPNNDPYESEEKFKSFMEKVSRVRDALAESKSDKIYENTRVLQAIFADRLPYSFEKIKKEIELAFPHYGAEIEKVCGKEYKELIKSLYSFSQAKNSISQQVALANIRDKLEKFKFSLGPNLPKDTPPEALNFSIKLINTLETLSGDCSKLVRGDAMVELGGANGIVNRFKDSLEELTTEAVNSLSKLQARSVLGSAVSLAASPIRGIAYAVTGIFCIIGKNLLSLGESISESYANRSHSAGVSKNEAKLYIHNTLDEFLRVGTLTNSDALRKSKEQSVVPVPEKPSEIAVHTGPSEVVEPSESIAPEEPEKIAPFSRDVGLK